MEESQRKSPIEGCEMKKVYVEDTHRATIVCPKCGLKKNVDVTNFKNTQKKLKAKCRCGEVFRLALEFRKHPRKKVYLNGEYSVHGRNEKGEVIIEDISAGGVRFASLKPHYISRNDTVELKFTLDDPMKTEIHKFVKIIWIIDKTLGTQYVDSKSLETELEFYLQT
jgi:transcription initiation factor TFIIIB Brf1 subunit/transcription initiation factor TFIIB